MARRLRDVKSMFGELEEGIEAGKYLRGNVAQGEVSLGGCQPIWRIRSSVRPL
jgi:hypothetical protein